MFDQLDRGLIYDRRFNSFFSFNSEIKESIYVAESPLFSIRITVI